MKLIYPVDQARVYLAQSYLDHVHYAENNGYCSKSLPKARCPKGYYYGGIDWAPNSQADTLHVYAAAGGTIQRVGFDKDNTETSGYGYHVRIVHPDGLTTIYGHLLPGSALVQVGEKVSVSKALGTMGGSGNCRPPGFVHLHFELRQGSQPIDPAPYLVAWGGGEIQPPAQPPIIAPPVDQPPFQYPPIGVQVWPYPAKWSLPPGDKYRSIRRWPSVEYGEIVDQLLPGQSFISDTIAPADTGLWVKMPSGLWVASVYPGLSPLVAERIS